MVKRKTLTTSILSTLLYITDSADAFWRMPCRARTGVGRLDPLVSPGQIADHSHVIHGGGDFSMNVKATELKDSDCTSCGVTQDKSAYWTPSLHFMFPNGTTVLVPQTGGMLAYYLLNKDSWDGTGKITAFPEGFQMLAGDMTLRNFTGPVPDPPAAQWTAAMQTQFSLSQKALGFNCMNYQKTGEPSLYRHFMPDKAFLDGNCPDGLRLELMFPSCWNGKDLDTPDHKSHVAYPNFVMTGICPEGFKTKLPSLFYETIWNTYAFHGIDGQFLLSYGDPTGYGYHGDFMMGWESTSFLQTAVDQCTNLSGLISDCAVFDIQSDYQAAECQFKQPSILKNDNVAGPRQGLPVGVPIQLGPGKATKYPVVGGLSTTAAVQSSSAPPAASVPQVPYTPKASSSSGVNLPVPAVTPSSKSAVATTKTTPASSKLTTAGSVVGKKSSSTPVKAASYSTMTAPPAASTSAAAYTGLPIVGTEYTTGLNAVTEVVIVQAYVTVTAMRKRGASAQATDAVEKRAEAGNPTVDVSWNYGVALGEPQFDDRVDGSEAVGVSEKDLR